MTSVEILDSLEMFEVSSVGPVKLLLRSEPASVNNAFRRFRMRFLCRSEKFAAAKWAAGNVYDFAFALAVECSFASFCSDQKTSFGSKTHWDNFRKPGFSANLF